MYVTDDVADDVVPKCHVNFTRHYNSNNLEVSMSKLEVIVPISLPKFEVILPIFAYFSEGVAKYCRCTV